MSGQTGIRIGPKIAGQHHKPFVIAEMSGNHNQSLESALRIVDAAAVAGADAIKLQTYTANTITLDIDTGDFRISDQNSLWNGRRLYDLYDEAHTPWEWHQPIMERARHHGLICFSSPFDESAVDFLEDLEVPAYKIASFEILHLPLIRKVAATGKPLIISTGMASIGEIDDAVSCAREAGAKDLILLKCTSSYPASPADSHIRTLCHLREAFNCEVGISDHTLGIGCALAAVAFGACVIEKHFTLRRSDGGVDSAFSLEPGELKVLVEEADRAWLSLGSVRYGPTKAEERSVVFRRSIYVSANIPTGARLTEENIRIVRPGFGLPPKYYDALLGRTVSRAVKCGTPLSWDLL